MAKLTKSKKPETKESPPMPKRKDPTSSSLKACPYSLNMRVEREIEGMFFPAVVKAVNARFETLCLEYLDDGNHEDGVPFAEVRSITTSEEETIDEIVQHRRNSDIGKLRKPLAGLIEDDDDERAKHVPTVTIHKDADSEVIILNGAENKLAAGGGLRALRYLNKTKS